MALDAAANTFEAVARAWFENHSAKTNCSECRITHSNENLACATCHFIGDARY